MQTLPPKGAATKSAPLRGSPAERLPPGKRKENSARRELANTALSR